MCYQTFYQRKNLYLAMEMCIFYVFIETSNNALLDSERSEE